MSRWDTEYRPNKIYLLYLYSIVPKTNLWPIPYYARKITFLSFFPFDFEEQYCIPSRKAEFKQLICQLASLATDPIDLSF